MTIFLPGQLVSPEPEMINDKLCVFLYDKEAGINSKETGHMEENDVGLVISVGRGGQIVYVVAPNGTGWAYGAFLKIVKQA